MTNLKFFILAAFITVAWSRIYDPKEADPNRIDHFLWIDENGHLYNESLVDDPTIIRRDVGIEDMSLILFTQNNPTEGEELRPSEPNAVENSINFDPKRENVFIVHGWNNDRTSDVNTEIREAIVQKHDHNIFVVDWSGPANWNYLSAKGAVTGIGDALGNFLNNFMDRYNLDSNDVVLIGHSLGAHVSGCAGAKMNRKPHYIIGLDPAGPLFSMDDTSNRLDTTDAHYVHAIHTCGGRLSLHSALGHSDYYPNGGKRQPGCGLDVVGACAHSRSYNYLAESIRDGIFTSHFCTSYDDYEEGLCFNNHASYLGSLDIDKGASGEYFLSTNDESPFALG